MTSSAEVEAQQAPAVEQNPTVEKEAPAADPDPTADQPQEQQPEKKKTRERAVKEKKPKAPKVKKNKPKAPAHPPYFQMIKEAITAINEKGGSSPYAIAKYMEQNHKAVLPANFRKILGLQLKNSVSKGKLVKVKASYKLSEAVKREKKKPTTTKATPKTRAAIANAAKPKEGGNNNKRKRPKSKSVSKIENAPVSTMTAVVPRARRSIKKSTPAKAKPPKSIKAPAAKKAKKVAAA